MAVLTNQESSAAFDSIVYRVADHYLGAPAFDWIASATGGSGRRETRLIAAERQKASERSRRDVPPLARALELRR